MQDFVSYLRDRSGEISQLKKKGIKVIGYFPGNYMPEELIYASGAVPVCLIDGEKAAPANTALSVVPNIICSFARTLIGEMMTKENPYYAMLDMVVAPITCQHLKKVAEIWEYQEDIEVFKLGVPHQYYNDIELDYYTERLKALRDRLQAFTGNTITDERINQAIDTYNRMRGLFRKLSLIRRSYNSPISALDFIKLNHLSLCADPNDMIEMLESFYSKITNGHSDGNSDHPRILIVGPIIARGDYAILEIVQAAGGEIVIEEICEGLRYYWHDIEKSNDPLKSLAIGYLRDRLPCAFMRDSSKKRLHFILDLIRNFNVSGVIWHELLNCETYDAESFFFSQELGKRNIPFLVLESDCGMADVERLKNRVDAFIELIKGEIE
ncbi:MAG: 2-hydroxyacyl-CoA dehydratase [Syntrophaceae bacterium]|nr:2-hydroxyacyl-CoA dehydratase [Syntrophaceae bacterium]